MTPQTAESIPTLSSIGAEPTAPELKFIHLPGIRLPLVSLHEHLLWSLSTTQVLSMANANGVFLPRKRIKGEYFEFDDMADMFKAHDQIRPAITKTPEDYKLALSDFLRFRAEKGVIYCEFMFSTQKHEDPDFFAKQIDAMAEAIENAREEFGGIEARGILNGIRHHGQDANHFMLDQLGKNRQRDSSKFITGFGLSGDEANHPPENFTGLFQRATDMGLNCTIHSGEVLGPDSIRKAIALPGVKRLGHGIRAVEDVELMQEIKERGITLELCPGSNLRLLPQYKNPNAKPGSEHLDYSYHPARRLLDAGIKTVLGPDDGPWFETSISREYKRLARALNLDLEGVLQFTVNGIEAAFVDDDTRAGLWQTYRQRLGDYGVSCRRLQDTAMTAAVMAKAALQKAK